MKPATAKPDKPDKPEKKERLGRKESKKDKNKAAVSPVEASQPPPGPLVPLGRPKERTLKRPRSVDACLLALELWMFPCASQGPCLVHTPIMCMAILSCVSRPGMICFILARRVQKIKSLFSKTAASKYT